MQAKEERIVERTDHLLLVNLTSLACIKQCPRFGTNKKRPFANWANCIIEMVELGSSLEHLVNMLKKQEPLLALPNTPIAKSCFVAV